MLKLVPILRLSLLTGCLMPGCLGVLAQRKIEVQLPEHWPKQLNLTAYTYSDSLSFLASVRRLIEDLHSRAYLEASADHLVWKDSVGQLSLHLGPVYRWANLRQRGIHPEWWRRSQQRYGNPGTVIGLGSLDAFKKDVVRQAANAGYPFAAIRLDSVVLEQEQMNAVLVLEKGPLIFLDTLRVPEDTPLKSAYLEHYLGLRPGNLYDHGRIERIQERMGDLPFVQLRNTPLLDFSADRATVVLELDRQRASRFDFLIGVLPNSQQVNRLLVTGTFEAELWNQFGRGERLYARFEQLRPRTPRLDLQGNYPFIANSPLGADFRLHLYRRDTAFLDLDVDLGLQYLLEGGNFLKLFWNQRSSRLLQLNEPLLLRERALPAALDVSYAAFGLEFQQTHLDYRFNPRRGWAWLGRGAAGTKRILRNNRIEELELGYLYDTLPQRVVQYRLLSTLEAYLPLGKNSTLQSKLNTGWTITDQAIYQNEQFRLGGNRLMRGFDEEFLFATHYVVGTLEARLLLSRNSYLYSFGDLGWISNRTVAIQEVYRVYGFGAGISFETKAGLFGLSLALGARWGEAVDFAGPKVHFGYVSLF